MQQLFLGTLKLLLFLFGAVDAYSSAWKLKTMNEHLGGDGTLSLDSKLYDHLCSGPRNFSLIVELTALQPQHNCEACKAFHESFGMVASSWKTLKNENRLYFATLDYSRGAEVFSRLKLTSAPLVQYFAPNEGKLAKSFHVENPDHYDHYDLGRMGYDAEDFGRYVESLVHTEIPVIRPVQYGRYVVGVLGLAVFAILARLIWDYVSKFLRNTLIWSVASLGVILFMISGHVWNSIRGAQYASRTEVFSGQFQYQYEIETHIMSFIYGVGSLALILLTFHAPRVQVASTQRLLTYAYTAVFVFACSLVIYCFRLKYYGYPYRLLF